MIWRTTYKNKAYLEVTALKKAKKGMHPSDLIRMRIVPADGKGTETYMHGLEAIDLIRTLSSAVGELIHGESILMSKD